MELVYLWINKCAHGCIEHQEFNFSPLHKFSVDNLDEPCKLGYELITDYNLFEKDNIKNVTAVVGSNGAGKTSILSYVANEGCYYEFDQGKEYSLFEHDRYEQNKSIYVFNNNGEFIVYHNLKNELSCDSIIKKENMHWNKSKAEKEKGRGIWDIRNQLIVYLTNSSIVPEEMRGYSRSGKTFNVNLHPNSMNIVANHFYKIHFNKNEYENFNEDDSDFAWQLMNNSGNVNNRYDKTFQELLDLLYFDFLIINKGEKYINLIKKEVYVYFESIISICETLYLEDIEKIEATKEGYYKFSKNKPEKVLYEKSKDFYKKCKKFYNAYSSEKIFERMQIDCTVNLYVNLLFEAFFYENTFDLPEIDFAEDIYTQIEPAFDKTEEKYKKYLADIKEIDAILYECENRPNLITNVNDVARKYQKVIKKDNHEFYHYIKKIFDERESYVLRYIRVENLEMSSGERAMQNMFSRLVLMPQLDDIMNIQRNSYESKLLLIDEIDLYSHPEWQRKSIKQLIDTIKLVEKVPIQIIITSHSPLCLSDFPKQNIIFLNNKNGKTVVEENIFQKNSFGANIYTLLNNTFFLENGAVGEFARETIYKIYSQLSEDDYPPLHPYTPKQLQQIINMVGDDLIHNELQKLFDKKYINKIIPKERNVQVIPENKKELIKLKKQLENSLNVINTMLEAKKND